LDGLDGVADGGAGIALFEAVALHVALHHGLTDGHAVIDEAEAAVTGARIVVPRRVVRVGQFDQRVVLAQGDRFGGRRDTGDAAGEKAAAAARATWAGRRAG